MRKATVRYRDTWRGDSTFRDSFKMKPGVRLVPVARRAAKRKGAGRAK